MNTQSPGDPDPVPLPSIDEAAIMLRSALGQLEFARRYTVELLEATPQDRWYEIPPGGVTNIAWQIGHLAVSQYGLMMFRMRGRHPDDLELIPGRFRKAFGRGSTPPPSAEGGPTADALMAKLDQVHRSAVQEVSRIDRSTLLDPVDMPYAVYPCKIGAILFCPMHETLHAGQIGLTRRALGLDPIR
ncbi:DinB family protein [Allorhodopirellula solitaria]|uniref:DinB superfamily protein n=1 Tax=Allorhodopirellula solitaria TaxID=2527987 RepID=A0A5C5X2D9_9BACT|nr:DinB family protein [Allorhodopirellula solitaria]TWT56335.1 DinB superfamily protein [Allorhodopirellula solitaria]